MKTGIFITARLGSTRLEKKHLLTVNNHPILFFLIKRIKEEFGEQLIGGEIKIIIVTSDEPENREFENFQKDGVTVFYGSINNIPLRHLQAAKAHSLDSIISIDGDDILCSVKGMKAAYDALLHGERYVKTSNLPFGMNSSGYSKEFLESSLSGHLDNTLETGWGRIFDQDHLVDIHIPFSVYDNSLRFTLDYDADYQFFKAIIEAFGDTIVTAQDEEIVKFVIDKELYRITEPIAKKYWTDFHRIQEKEKQESNTADLSSGDRMYVDKKLKKVQMKDQYVAGLQIDSEIALQRQRFYVENKTRQQCCLEDLIEQDNFEFKKVADVACGGGGGGASCLLVESQIPSKEICSHRS